jgi:hypothetical protein
MRTARTVFVSRALWQWAQDYDADFQRDIWRIVMLRRLFADTKRRAVWTILVPAGLVFVLMAFILEQADWAPFALGAYLLVLAVATHRFGTRLRSIAWETRRVYRLNHALWMRAAPELTELLKRERLSERTLRVQVVPPDA